MARRPTDPLTGILLLFVDGNNLLHARPQGPGAGGSAPGRPTPPAPARGLIGRLRAVIPAGVRIEVVFDGPPDPGLGGSRLASGVTVRYAGRRSADAVITELVARADRSAPGRPAILVVSDDRGLREAVGGLGARTVPNAWLLERLGRTRLASPTVGRSGSPRPAGDAATPGDEDERPPWRPGRGATTKRGNPRRRPRTGPATMPR